VLFDNPERLRHIDAAHASDFPDDGALAACRQFNHHFCVRFPHMHVRRLMLTRRQINDDAKSAYTQHGGHPSNITDRLGYCNVSTPTSAYDPVSWAFTQEDPIGLAGGLNLYGFAGGDPVNFSDPFGLCPQNVSVAQGIACVLIESTTAILGSGAGFTLGGGGGLLASIPTLGLAAPVTVPAGAIAGAAVGGVAGKLTGEAITNALFAKGAGREFRGGSQSQRDPDHDRLMKEFSPTRREQTRIHEEIARQKRGSSNLEYDEMRQIFLDIVKRSPGTP